MGLTNCKNSPDGLIYKYDVGIAKNYLNEQELKKLNNLTTLFLDYAEDMAEEQNIMTMQKWIDITDKLISFRDKKVLKDSGKISCCWLRFQYGVAAPLHYGVFDRSALLQRLEPNFL